MSLYQLELAHKAVSKMMSYDYKDTSNSDSDSSSPSHSVDVYTSKKLHRNPNNRSSESKCLENNGPVQHSCKEKITVHQQFPEKFSRIETRSYTRNSLLKNKSLNGDTSSTCYAKTSIKSSNKIVKSLSKISGKQVLNAKQPTTIVNLKRFEKTLYKRKYEPLSNICCHRKGSKTVPNILRKAKKFGKSKKNIVSVKQLNDIVKGCSIRERTISRRKNSNIVSHGLKKSVKKSKTLIRSDPQLTPCQIPVNDTECNKQYLGQFKSVIHTKNGNLSEIGHLSNETEEINYKKMPSFSSECSASSSHSNAPISKCLTVHNNEKRKVPICSYTIKSGLELFSCNTLLQNDNSNNREQSKQAFKESLYVKKEPTKHLFTEDNSFICSSYDSLIMNDSYYCNEEIPYQSKKIRTNLLHLTDAEDEVLSEISPNVQNLIKSGERIRKRFRNYTFLQKYKKKGEYSRIIKIMEFSPEHLITFSNSKSIIEYFLQKCHMLTVKFYNHVIGKTHVQNMRFDHFFLFSKPKNIKLEVIQGKKLTYNYLLHCENIIFFLLKLCKIAPVSHSSASHFTELYDILTLSGNDLSSMIKNVHFFTSAVLFFMPLLQYLFAHKNLMKYFYCFMLESQERNILLSIKGSSFCPNVSLSNYTDFKKKGAESVQMNHNGGPSEFTFPVSDKFCVDHLEVNGDGIVRNKTMQITEEVDTVDGIDIFSFETEKDMEEYTKMQFNRMEQNLECLRSSDLSKSPTVSAIIPTKTNDITQIKGWRNKNFASKADSSSSDDSQCFSNQLPYYGESNILENKSAPCKLSKDQLEDCGAKKTSEDVLQRMGTKTSMTCDLKNSVFESNILNEFLNKHSTLNISYEVPKLSAADCFKCDNRMLFDSISSKTINNLASNPTESNISHFSSCKPKTKAQKRLLMEMEILEGKNKIGKCKSDKDYDSSLAVKKAKRPSKCLMKNKYNINPNYKYMWIQGRPIRILGCKADSGKKKKFLVPTVDLDCHSDLRKPEALLSKKSVRTEVKDLNKICSDNNHNNMKYSQNEDDKKLNSLTFSVHDKEAPKTQYKIMPKNVDGNIEINKSNYACNSKHLAEGSVHVMYSCHSNSSEKHNSCGYKADNYKLGLILNIGFNRPLSSDAVHNFNALKPNENVIDECWAYVAASALQSCDRKYKKVTRVIVPVVSENIIKKTKSVLSDISGSLDPIKSYDLKPFLNNIEKFNIESKKVMVFDEVKDVLDGVVDYVCRLSEVPPISYDPDAPKNISEDLKLIKKKCKDKTGTTGVERELRRLINVSIVDVTPDSNSDDLNVCKRECCIKGCVCASLNGKLTQTHCRKESCMFDCKCPDNRNNMYGYLRYQPKERKLAKEEKTWHQTVIRKQNKVISVMVGTERVKREKKLPSRFRNNVLVGKEVFSLESRSEQNEFNSKYSGINSKYLDPAKPGKNSVLKSVKSGIETSSTVSNGDKKKSKTKKEPEKKIKGSIKIESVKRTTLCKILNFRCNSLNFEKKSLADVLVWCVVHNIYNCNCSAWVCDFKNSHLLWRPTRVCKYLSRKHMATIELSNVKKFLKLQMFNTEKYCCRTFGSVTNYALRNKSQIFELKRLREFETSCFSYSNSIYKVRRKGKFLMDFRLPVDDIHTSDDNEIVTRATESYSKNSSLSLKTHELEYLSSSLPRFSVPCKWWVIEFLPIFDFLLFDERRDPISFGMLKKAVENTKWRKSVVHLPLPDKSNMFGIHFGAYAVNELQNIICFGPYRLEDDHGLMLYKVVNRDIKVISVYNFHNKTNEEVNAVKGFWCYVKQRDDACNTLCNQPKGLPLCDSKGTNEKQESGLLLKLLNYKKLKDNSGKRQSNSSSHQPKKPRPSTKLPVNAEKFEEYTETVLSNQSNHSSDNKKKPNQICSQKSSTVINSVAKEQNSCFEANEKKRNNFSPEYGLLCLTSDIGYLPVTEYTSTKLTVQDPLDTDIYHTFKNLESTCAWLNRYMSRKMIFEPEDLLLDWIIVKPGILQHISTFDPQILNKSYVVTKEGVSLVSHSNKSHNKKHITQLSQFIPYEKPKFKSKVDSQNININKSKSTPAKRQKMEPNLRINASIEKHHSRHSQDRQTQNFLEAKNGPVSLVKKITAGAVPNTPEYKLSPHAQTNSVATGNKQKSKLVVDQTNVSTPNETERKCRFLLSSDGDKQLCVKPSNKVRNNYCFQHVNKEELMKLTESQVVKKGVKMDNMKLYINKSVEITPHSRTLKPRQNSAIKRKEHPVQILPYNPALESKQNIGKGHKRQKMSVGDCVFKLTQTSETTTEIAKLPSSETDYKLKTTTKYHKVPIESVTHTTDVSKLKGNSDGYKGLPFIHNNPEISITEIPKDVSASDFAKQFGKGKRNVAAKKMSVLGGMKAQGSMNKEIGDNKLKSTIEAVLSHSSSTNNDLNAYKSSHISIGSKKSVSPISKKGSSVSLLNKRSTTIPVFERVSSSGTHSILKSQFKNIQISDKLKNSQLNMKQIEADFTKRECQDNPDVKLKEVREKISQYKYSLGGQYQILDLVDSTSNLLPKRVLANKTVVALKGGESQRIAPGSLVSLESNNNEKNKMICKKNMGAHKKSVTEAEKKKVTSTEVHIVRNKLIGSRKSKSSTVVSPEFSSGDIFLDGKKLCSIPLIMPKTESKNLVSKTK